MEASSEIPHRYPGELGTFLHSSQHDCTPPASTLSSDVDDTCSQDYHRSKGTAASPCHKDILNSRSDEPSTSKCQINESIVSSMLSEKSGQKTPGHDKTGLNFLQDWWLELGSCLMSLAALVALIVTLHAYQGRPSPDWPTWISLNTIVAIYTVVLKAGIVLVAAEGIGQLKWNWLAKDRCLYDLVRYDDASRGPVGALVLLWTLRARYILASCGALIALLALAVDPLAQQIIHYYNCAPVVANTSVELPRSNFLWDKDAPLLGAGLVGTSPGVQNALITGVLSPGNPVSVDCSTGNCSWPGEFSTVGWSSECKDVSHLLSFDKITIDKTGDWELKTSLPDGGVSVTTAEFADPPMPFAAMGPAPSAVQNDPASIYLDFVIGKQSWGAIRPLTGDQSSYQVCRTTAGKDQWKCKGYGAARCRLFPCVKTYKASVETGKLTETLLHTATEWGDLVAVGWSPGWSMVDLSCLDTRERSLLSSLGYDFTPRKRWLPYPQSFDKESVNDGFLNNALLQSLSKHDCLYAANMDFVESLGVFLKGEYSPFRGIVEGGTPIVNGDYGLFFGSQIVQAFFNLGDVDLQWVNHKFQNVTESLTSYMRQNGLLIHAPTGQNKPAPGRMTQFKTCIGVRWPWLAFPASLIVSTWIFLAFVALGAIPELGQLPVWKSFPLALLYHGFKENDIAMRDAETGTGVVARKEMEAASRHTIVKLNTASDNGTHLEVRHREHR